MLKWYNFKEEIDMAPDTKGVYILADDRHNVVYVSAAKDLHKELSKHPDPSNQCLRQKNVQYFAFEETPNSESKETQLITEHDPECNRA